LIVLKKLIEPFLKAFCIGVRTLKDDEAGEVATLLERADQALYSAKNSGRNQLRGWQKHINGNRSDVFFGVSPVSFG
jgi:PleD family two-component response regulator